MKSSTTIAVTTVTEVEMPIADVIAVLRKHLIAMGIPKDSSFTWISNEPYRRGAPEEIQGVTVRYTTSAVKQDKDTL